MKTRSLVPVSLVVCVLVFAACGAAEPEPTATPVPPPPTDTPVPALPTDTPEPPPPTPTPAPPTPTATPIPPTPTAEPILTGRIDVGGFHLYIDCIGDGSPTVVLDSGLGKDRHEWDEVLALVNSDPPTRVCVYDRRGLGRSDILPREPRTTQVMVNELGALLEAAHIPSPYILAGHSAAGLNAWLFASQYPDEVAGVIMVDSSHPDQTARSHEAMEPFKEGEYSEIAQELTAPRDPMGMPEYWDGETSYEEARAAGPFGEIPLVVLTRDTSNIEPQLAFLRKYYGPDLPAELVEALENALVPLQEELTELSTNSVHIIVENSSHMIPLERPEAVVDAIRQVMEMAETDALE